MWKIFEGSQKKISIDSKNHEKIIKKVQSPLSYQKPQNYQQNEKKLEISKNQKNSKM